MNFPCLHLLVMGVRPTVESHLLGSITADLSWGNVGCIAVFLLDLRVKDLVSHNINSFFAEQWEWIGDGNWRYTFASREAYLFHGVDVFWLLECKMFGRVEKLPNGRRTIVCSEVLLKRAFQ